MIAVRLQELMRNHVPRTGHNRTAADAADLNVNPMLHYLLTKTHQRNSHPQAHFVIVGRKTNHQLLTSKVEALFCLHKSPVENGYASLVGQLPVDTVDTYHSLTRQRHALGLRNT